MSRTRYVAYGSNRAMARFRCHLSGRSGADAARDRVGPRAPRSEEP